jgi:hypothetical protein
VCTLRVQDQAKQDAYTGPLLAVAFLRGSHLATRNPKQENNQGTPCRSQVPQTDLPARQRKATDHMRVKKCKNRHKVGAQFNEHNCEQGEVESF